MTLAYDVKTEDDVLIGRMWPSSEIIVGMMKTQFLPDSTRKFVPAILEGRRVWDEAHNLQLGTLVKPDEDREEILSARPVKMNTVVSQKVRVFQTLGGPLDDYQYPKWDRQH